MKYQKYTDLFNNAFLIRIMQLQRNFFQNSEAQLMKGTLVNINAFKQLTISLIYFEK